MKTGKRSQIRRLLLFLPVAAAVVSCDLQVFENPVSPEGFMAYAEEHSAADTRTSLDKAGAVLWTKGDVIRVYKASAITAGYHGHDFTIDPSCDGKERGIFSEEGYDDYYTEPCYAVFPPSVAVGMDGQMLSVSLPRVQKGMENSFGRSASPAVSNSPGNGMLPFSNLCGLVAIRVTGAAPISEIKITTAADEALWGTGKVDMNYKSRPFLIMDKITSEDQKSLILEIEDPDSPDGQFISSGASSSASGGVLTGDAERERVYYMAIPAGTLSQGFTVTVVTSDKKYMQKYAVPSESNRIERSVCTVMPDVRFEDESKVKIRTDVLNKAFYKDLFMDSGAGIGKFRTQPFINYMGLEYEYFFAPRENFTAADLAKQKLAFAGSPEDLNGVLLYPDGEPRFRMIYVNGGYSTEHGRNLFAEARENFNKFFYNGGSYCGSCAGAMVSARGSVGNAFTSTAGYLGFWPGFHNSLSITDIYPTYILPDDSPVLRYYDFGGDHKVEEIKHWNGPYFKFWEDAPGTEVLCVNDLSGYDFDGYPSVIAYKPSIWSGRVIPVGGHPEQSEEKEQLDLMASFVKYCFDGQGIAKAKGVLRNGEVRLMTKSTEENDPDFTKVGDRQCHHFVFALPEGARNIRVRLESLEGFNLSLRLAEGTFAFKEDAKYSLENGDKVKELSFDKLPAGTWYVGVQCEDAPEVSFGDYGYIYSGNTAVLNGAPYSISVKWE
ncbi:MAG: hypothetical protein J5699_05575 [Bacteroidales bacterium]|nr:hypothetical protein [Bacteroidales bacterium]